MVGSPSSHKVAYAGSKNRHMVGLLARDRYIFGDDTHTGEVLYVAKSYMWVRPLGPLPFEVETVLSEASEFDHMLYVAMADIEEDGLVLDVGTKVLFKCYKDHKGVGGCEVTSA